MDEDTVRLVLIGNAYVGKTALITRFVERNVPDTYKQTIGAAFHTFQQKLGEIVLTVQVWDTAGQEKFRSLGPAYYRKASAAIAVFDVTDQKSFDDLNDWILAFQEVAGSDAHVFIAGNKSDLEPRMVDQGTAQVYADDKGFTFVETSAITGCNVDRLFQGIIEAVYTTNTSLNVNEPQKVVVTSPTAKKSKCC